MIMLTLEAAWATNNLKLNLEARPGPAGSLPVGHCPEQSDHRDWHDHLSHYLSPLLRVTVSESRVRVPPGRVPVACGVGVTVNSSS
jgi:hypothetical protein